MNTLTPPSLLIFRSHRVPLHLFRIVALLFLIPFNISYVLPQSSSVPPKVATEYDRFTDETKVGVSTTVENYTVKIPFGEMQEFLILIAWFSHRGQTLTAPPTMVRIAFRSQARAWRFGEGTELRGIVDGERIALGRMGYTQTNLGAGHIEVLQVDVPTRTFIKLARSKSVELRIGSKELKLRTQDLAALISLANRITEIPAARINPKTQNDTFRTKRQRRAVQRRKAFRLQGR